MDVESVIKGEFRQQLHRLCQSNPLVNSAGDADLRLGILASWS